MMNVYLLCIATNRIEAIDPAVLRPGRFDEHVYIPLPSEQVTYILLIDPNFTLTFLIATSRNHSGH